MHKLFVAALIMLVALASLPAMAQTQNPAPQAAAKAEADPFRSSLASIEFEPARIAAIATGAIASVVIFNTLSRIPLFSTVLADLGHGIMFVTVGAAGGVVGNYYFQRLLVDDGDE